MSFPVLGVDIAKATFQVTLLQDGRKCNRTFQNRSQGFVQMDAWLAKHQTGRVHTCMEATGRYWEELALHLHEAGHIVSVVNPMCIHNFAKSRLARNKTDRLDAELIARYCATHAPAPWSPPAAEVRKLQAMTHHLEALQTMRTQENNRLSSGVPSPQVRSLLEEHLCLLDRQIKELLRGIQEHIDRHPGLRRDRDLLVSIPGIGELTAAKLLGENIPAFTSRRALAAYAGLSPRNVTSGTSVRRKPQLSKVGNPSLRKAMYLPAVVARRFNPIINAFCQRLQERGKCKMVVIGAAMRKLLCLALGVLKSGKPFDPNYLVNARVQP